MNPIYLYDIGFLVVGEAMERNVSGNTDNPCIEACQYVLKEYASLRIHPQTGQEGLIHEFDPVYIQAPRFVKPLPDKHPLTELFRNTREGARKQDAAHRAGIHIGSEMDLVPRQIRKSSFKA